MNVAHWGLLKFFRAWKRTEKLFQQVLKRMTEEREMSDEVRNLPTVLAVDDSIVIQQMVKRFLEPEYRVLVVDNAVEALSMVYHEAIAILLLDVLMPGVDGLEFCRTLRSLPQFQTLPVVMVTSRDSPFDRVQGRLAGATEYLTKPFEPEQLRQIVRKFVSVSSAG